MARKIFGRDREEEEIDFAGFKLRKSDREKSIVNPKNLKWGRFKIRALWPKDQREVANVIASYCVFGVQNYQPADLARFERDAAVQVGVIKGPPWWEGPGKCPSESILNWLNKEILGYTEELQKKIGADGDTDSEGVEETGDDSGS